MGSSNPYDDTQVWLPEQREMLGASYSDPTYYAPAQQQTLINYPYYTSNISGAQTVPQGNLGPQHTRQNKKDSARMPKAQAVSMARTLKRSIVVASIAGFGVLSGLVATHLQTTTTTSQSTSTSASQNTSSSSSNASSTSSSNSSTSNADSNQSSSNTNSGGFFNQQGGGYGFGNGSSSQAPVGRSRVS
jgi:cytoskeletal protein RodZ